MSDVREPLDYNLQDEVDGRTAERMKALGDPLRLLLLDLVLERAMTVTELAERVGRPRGSVAHHVDLLVRVGLLQVVRTRRVRAVDERFYGRVARTITMPHMGEGLPFFAEAQSQADYARMDRDDGTAGFTMRHARVPAARAAEYLERLMEIAVEFSAQPRDGDVEYALITGVFPTVRTVAPTLARAPRKARS